MAYPKARRNSYMKPLTLVFEGKPVPRARPRFGKGEVHSDPKNDAAKDEMSLRAKAQMAKVGMECPFEGAVTVRMDFYFRRPKPTNANDRTRHVMMGSGELKHVNTPDVDNLAKMVLDAFNDIVWEDDCQVWNIEARKHYVGPGHETKPDGSTYVRVEPHRYG